MRGEVRSWKGDWGFVICPSKFDGDLFAHKANWKCASEPTAGQVISFTVAQDTKGRCTAHEMTEPESAPEDLIGQGRASGVVRSWRDSWGFVVAPGYFEGDLFLPKAELPQEVRQAPSHVLEKELIAKEVTFEVRVDNKGRPCAGKVEFTDLSLDGYASDASAGHSETAAHDLGQTQPSVQSLSLSSTPEDGGGERLQGRLRKWRDPWGFVVCPGRFDGDLFAHKQNFVTPPPPGCDGGLEVEFELSQDSKGRPQAVNIVVQYNGEVPSTHYTAPTQVVEAMQPQDEQASQPANIPPEAMGQQLVGTVRKWRDQWGFLISPGNFEGDIFVHSACLPEGAWSLTPGANVFFEVGTDTKGRTIARNISAAHTIEDWLGTRARIGGRVRSWRDQWGFIISPTNFSGDIFCHKAALPPQLVGAVAHGLDVTFVVDRDNKGRCIAIEVQARPPDPGKRPGPVGSFPDAKRPHISSGGWQGW